MVFALICQQQVTWDDDASGAKPDLYVVVLIKVDRSHYA